ncbi:hypothetical protein PALB_14640 [Pseudoalteromonas luteoviolacea B = ATCC 29581]|nr:hypothetical protein PALB_14640 [Pseudoalteromonas luteoviolacea B = ATCC 29581]
MRLIFLRTLFALLPFVSLPGFSQDDINSLSDLSINYQDVDHLLKSTVVDLGLSDRKSVRSRNTAIKTGTRFRYSKNKKSRLEANRFLFKEAKKANLERLIADIRLSIEHVSTVIDIALLEEEEQLAFWLNLYTVGILEQLVKMYPKHDLKEELTERHSFLNRKFIKVEGINISLNDIKYRKVLPYFDNPVVIYGFYQGIVGSPSLTSSAFTKENVYARLGYLAREFINSNRGVIYHRANKISVSNYYTTVMMVFDDDETRLLSHLSEFANPDVRYAVKTAQAIKFDLADWTVTDLDGDYRYSGGAYITSSAELVPLLAHRQIGSLARNDGETINLSGRSNVENLGLMRISPEMIEYYNKIKGKYLKRKSLLYEEKL